jgi:hypothetical protein
MNRRATFHCRWDTVYEIGRVGLVEEGQRDFPRAGRNAGPHPEAFALEEQFLDGSPALGQETSWLVASLRTAPGGPMWAAGSPTVLEDSRPWQVHTSQIQEMPVSNPCGGGRPGAARLVRPPPISLSGRSPLRVRHQDRRRPPGSIRCQRAAPGNSVVVYGHFVTPGPDPRQALGSMQACCNY